MDRRDFVYSLFAHGVLVLGLWMALLRAPASKMSLHRVLPVKLVPIGAITAAPRPPRRKIVKPIQKLTSSKRTKPQPKRTPVAKPSVPKIRPKQKTSLPKKAPNTIKPAAPSSQAEGDAFDKLLEDVSSLKDTKTSKAKGFESDLISNKLSLSELDALRQQIQKCWVIPPSMLSEKNILVEVGVHLDPKGFIQSLKILNRSPPLKGPIFQVAVQSIRQAMKAPECTPLRMPKGKHDQWKYCVLRFQPRGVA